MHAEQQHLHANSAPHGQLQVKYGSERPHSVMSLCANTDDKAAYVLKVDRLVLVAIAENDPEQLKKQVDGIFGKLLTEAGI